MKLPRLRVFAGPNGSGKSTLYEKFSAKYSTGLFLNADIIENTLMNQGFIDLNDIQLSLDQNDFDKFCFTKRAASLIQKSKIDSHEIDIAIVDNIIIDKSRKNNSYEGALISLFLRNHLLEKNIDFCFETVMSHPSKIDEILEAKVKGFKTYLYYICTDDPIVNISRVENRVKKGGHNVSKEKIESRYFNSLKNLISAIEVCDKSYIFDNSQERFRLIAKINESGELELNVNANELPNWFILNLLSHYSF